MSTVVQTDERVRKHNDSKTKSKGENVQLKRIILPIIKQSIAGRKQALMTY